MDRTFTARWCSLLVCTSAFALLTSANLNAALSVTFTRPHFGSDDSLRVNHAWSQMRFSGHTDPDASLTLDGREVQVWSTGAFAGLLEDLEVGENNFTFEARLGGDTWRRTVTVVRPPPPEPLPPSPAQILPDSVSPSEPWIVAPGDEVQVSFNGSRGGRASATLGRHTRLTLTEDPSTPGRYVGVHRATGDEGWQGDEITVRLSVDEGDPLRVEHSVSDALWNLDTERLRVLEVTAADRTYAPLYRNPNESGRLADLPPGTRLTVWGRRGDQWRVRLAPDVFAWVPRNTSREQLTQELPAGTPPPQGAFDRLEARIRPRSAVLNMEFDDRVPVCAEQIDSQSFRLLVYGLTEERAHPPQDMPPDAMVGALEWERLGDGIHAMNVTLRRPLWGWDLQWQGTTLALRMVSSPIFAPPPASPLEGLRIVADAGHGGSDPGASGSTGLREDDVNLMLAQALADSLALRGAEVALTRAVSTHVSLNERVRMASEAEGDLFLSIHNNSIGPTSDPLAVSGASVYHSHAMAEDLAQSILANVATIEDIANGGVHRSNLRVTRPSARPSVLIETLYLSHPGDEALLLSEPARRAISDAIALGTEAWAENRRLQTFPSDAAGSGP